MNAEEIKKEFPKMSQVEQLEIIESIREHVDFKGKEFANWKTDMMNLLLELKSTIPNFKKS